MVDRKYPEHEKLKAVKEQSQTCGNFLEWLQEQGILLAQYHVHTDRCFRAGCDVSSGELYPVSASITKLLAQYFEIDEDTLEQEKRQMLEELQPSGGK